MRNLALVTISLIGVIALLDVAASFALNGTVDVPVLLVLVVVVAFIVQLTAHQPTDGDVVTLLRLRRHLASLERHTRVLTDHRQVVDSSIEGGPRLTLDQLLNFW